MPMSEQQTTLFVRVTTRAPREVIAAALERLEGGPGSFSHRAEYLLEELHRQGYEIRRR
jgi:hypothetical protein